MGREHARDPLMAKVGMTFDDEAAHVLTQAYFMLSESYRTFRSDPEHLTNHAKIAAICCAAICAVQPLRHDKPDFRIAAVRYANPMFAMRCAESIIKHPW